MKKTRYSVVSADETAPDLEQNTQGDDKKPAPVSTSYSQIFENTVELQPMQSREITLPPVSDYYRDPREVILSKAELDIFEELDRELGVETEGTRNRNNRGDSPTVRRDSHSDERTTGSHRSHGLNRTRQFLISWRLKPCYITYCICCLAASSLLFIYTIIRGHASNWQEDLYNELTWTEWLELFIGFSIVIETFISYRVAGRHVFFRDKWCVFDLLLSALTLLSWVFILCSTLEWASWFEDDLEMPLLATRFGLQPLRVVSTFMTLYKSRKMQREGNDVHFEMTSVADDIQTDQPTEFKEQLLSLVSFLPVSLRFQQWYLAYSPEVHGLSIHTLYRRLEGIGAALIILRDDKNAVIGGFTSNGINSKVQRSEKNTTDSSSSFVFDKRLNVYYYREDPMPALFCNDTMLSFGRALTINSDFLRGSSTACNAYTTVEFLGSNDEFVITHLEIWCWEPIVDEATMQEEVRRSISMDSPKPKNPPAVPPKSSVETPTRNSPIGALG